MLTNAKMLINQKSYVKVTCFLVCGLAQYKCTSALNKKAICTVPKYIFVSVFKYHTCQYIPAFYDTLSGAPTPANFRHSHQRVVPALVRLVQQSCVRSTNHGEPQPLQTECHQHLELIIIQLQLQAFVTSLLVFIDAHGTTE